MPEANKFVDSAGLATYTGALSRKLSRIYSPKGSAIYADSAYLASGNVADPAIDSVGLWQQVEGYWTKITTVSPGWVYNISNAFTTTSDFLEGASKTVPAGTNISVVNTGTDADPVLKFDVLAMPVDLSALNTAIVTKQAKSLESQLDIILPDATVSDATALTALTTSSVSDGDIIYQEDTEEYYYADVTNSVLTLYDIGNVNTVEGVLKLVGSLMPIKPISTAEIQAMFE